MKLKKIIQKNMCIKTKSRKDIIVEYKAPSINDHCSQQKETEARKSVLEENLS